MNWIGFLILVSCKTCNFILAQQIHFHYFESQIWFPIIHLPIDKQILLRYAWPQKCVIHENPNSERNISVKRVQMSLIHSSKLRDNEFLSYYYAESHVIFLSFIFILHISIEKYKSNVLFIDSQPVVWLAVDNLSKHSIMILYDLTS